MASTCQHASCANNHFVICFIWVNSQDMVQCAITSIVYHTSRFGPFPLWAALKAVLAALTKPLGPSQALFLSFYVPNVRRLRAFPQLKCYRSGIIPSNDNVTGGKMTAEVEMTIDERRKYLRKMKSRYRKATR